MPFDANEQLRGTWVTSHTGWQSFDPRPEQGTDTITEWEERIRAFPPLIGGHGWEHTTDSFPQREGYFLYSVITCLRVAEDGVVTGGRVVLRGGYGAIRQVRLYDGEIFVSFLPELGVHSGAIRIKYEDAAKPPNIVTEEYDFYMQSPTEFVWMWAGATRPDPASGEPIYYRGIVASGVARKVRSEL